jgi:DNA-binding SARP family transcriptional activator
MWLETKAAYRDGLPFTAPLQAFVTTCEQARLTCTLGRAAREAPHLFLAGMEAVVSPLYAAVLPLLNTDQLNELAALATDPARPILVRQVAWHLLARQADSPVTIQAAKQLSLTAADAGLNPAADAGLGPAAARLLQSLRHGRPERNTGEIEFRTLGDVALTYRGREARVPWRRKGQALFALLMAIHPRPLTRLQAQEALWPDLYPQAAANNLRVVVHNLRRTLASLWADETGRDAPPLNLICNGDTIWLDGADTVIWDARALDASVATARNCVSAGDLRGAMTAYSHAVALYRGPYMPDSAFDATFSLDREHYDRIAYEAMLELSALHLDHGEPEQALAVAERAIDLDPLDEIGYQLTMRAYAALGYPHRAAATFARYTATIAAETGAKPTGTTERLLQQLLQNREIAVAAPS